MKVLGTIGLWLVLALAHGAAHADVYSFNFTPLPNFSTPESPVSFTLNTLQAPAFYGPVFNGSTFYYTNVQVLSNGSACTCEVGFGSFLFDLNGNYNALEYEFGAGQSVLLNGGSIYAGPGVPSTGFFSDVAFFAGVPGAPVFLPGVYSYPQDGILTIKDQTTVTPEPSSLVLLGTALLGGVGLLRRRVVRA